MGKHGEIRVKSAYTNYEIRTLSSCRRPRRIFEKLLVTRLGEKSNVHYVRKTFRLLYEHNYQQLTVAIFVCSANKCRVFARHLNYTPRYYGSF